MMGEYWTSSTTTLTSTHAGLYDLYADLKNLYDDNA